MGISKEYILKLLSEVQRIEGIVEYQEPDIVYIKQYNGTLHIIVYDRSDKATLIGYGGYTIKELKKRLGMKNIVINTITDLIVKRLRILKVLKILDTIPKGNERLKYIVENHLKPLLKAELTYPPRKIPKIKEAKENLAVVALSGGVDSTATLYIAKSIGLNPIAVTVYPGPYIIPDNVKEWISKIVKTLNVPHVFLRPLMGYKQIINDTLAGRRMPCSTCNIIIGNTILKYAFENNIPLIIFGDALATSSRAVRMLKGNIALRVNLPAALSLTKYDTTSITLSNVGEPPVTYAYGCPLLRIGMRKHRWMRFIAIERICREARAGILGPMEALRYIKNILKIPMEEHGEFKTWYYGCIGVDF